MAVEGLMQYLKSERESHYFEMWKKSIGAGQFDSSCVNELVEDFITDMKWKNIHTWSFYMMSDSLVDFSLFGFDHTNLEAEMNDHWLIFRVQQNVLKNRIGGQE